MNSRPTHHIGDMASAIAAAATTAFASGMTLTQREVQTRAARPHAYLAGVRIEIRCDDGVTSQRFEYASDASMYVIKRMRALESQRRIGAEVVAWIERPARTQGDVIREPLVHRRLDGVRPRPDAPITPTWVEVAASPEVVTAEAPDEEPAGDVDVDDEGGPDADR